MRCRSARTDHSRPRFEFGARNGVFPILPPPSLRAQGPCYRPPTNREQRRRDSIMSKEQENKAIVGRWFKEFWGSPWNQRIVYELAAPDMLLQYSLHAPRRGRAD